MKKTMKKLLFVLPLIVVGSFMGCGKEESEDLTAPTIAIEEPKSGASFKIGTEVHFEAEFKDNEALATYHLDIHDNFDGHSHGRILVEKFRYEKSFEVSGKSMKVEEHIGVPKNATAGPYDLIVHAVDADGNSTSFKDASSKLLKIWLTNDEMPHIHFKDANGGKVTEFEGEAGKPLSFYGEVEDGVGELQSVRVMVGHLEDASGEGHDHSARALQEEHIYEEEFPVSGNSSVLIQDLLAGKNISISQAQIDKLEKGEHYHLIVRAEDGDENISQAHVEIHFD